jgi:UDP-glucose:(heptosyl)LPS alpha-1,3-glucosyltransferase
MAKPHTLLLLIEHFRMAGAGAENYAVNVCRRLAARQYDIQVCAEDADVDGIPAHLGLRNAAAVAARINADLVIDWGFSYPADIHRLGGGVHSEFLRYRADSYSGIERAAKALEHQAPKHRRIVAREAELLSRPKALFLANSDFTAAQAQAGGAEPNNVRVLYNGVDPSYFKADADARKSRRQEWGVEDDDIACLFCAHNLKLKNLDLLQRVFDELTTQLRSARLVVIGKRPPKRRADWLIYAGQQSDMPACYSAGDLLLHPTYFDACANVVLEAMSCGLPVIVSDTSGINGILGDDSGGLVLPVRGDRQQVQSSWQQAIESLFIDAEHRQRMGQMARRTAEHQNMDRYMDNFEIVLQAAFDHKRNCS